MCFSGFKLLHNQHSPVMMVSVHSLAICLFLVCCSSSVSADLLGQVQEEWSVFPSMNVPCLVKNCLKEAEGCLGNAECRKNNWCSFNCMVKLWDNDTTPEKYHVQNCTNICAFSYRAKAYDNFMSCVSTHHCMAFPPIPSRCRAPGNLTVIKQVTIKDMAGLWWVVQGYHPVYDCYPCQHMKLWQVNNNTWTYRPRYQVYLANGSLGLIESQWNISDPESGSELSFAYHDAGLVHYENWWLFDAADDLSYILLYYCGNTLEWYYDGALVLSREKTLSAADYTKIASSYMEAVGLDSSKFCYTKTYQCPD